MQREKKKIVNPDPKGDPAVGFRFTRRKLYIFTSFLYKNPIELSNLPAQLYNYRTELSNLTH
jgi:hypothetical protein